MHAGVLIPIVAILGSFAIPIVAIVMDFRRRKLMFEERRAMIERGMDLPPLQDSKYEMGKRSDPIARRESSLRKGLVLTFLGIGIGVAAWLSLNVLDPAYIQPVRNVSGWMVIGSAVVTFLGIGNLVYFAVTAKPGNTPSAS
ncbi:MAG: DUF6249 domain-containing protein [Pseudomonadota bacterium]